VNSEPVRAHLTRGRRKGLLPLAVSTIALQSVSGLPMFIDVPIYTPGTVAFHSTVEMVVDTLTCCGRALRSLRAAASHHMKPRVPPAEE
jgi:hypothetical protein